MLNRKLGKLAPKLDTHGMRLSAHAFDKLPAIKPQPEWVCHTGTLPMLLNDSLGCCTASSKANITLHMTRCAQAEIVWPDSAVLALYEATGHYVPGNPATDNGAIMSEVNNYMWSNGIDIGKQAPEIFSGVCGVDHTNLDHLCLAIDIFGAVDCGWQLTEAMLHSTNGRWDYVPGSKVEGGHCTPLIYYRTINGKREFLTPSWAEYFWVSEECVETSLEEAMLIASREHWTRRNNSTPHGETFDEVLSYATGLRG